MIGLFLLVTFAFAKSNVNCQSAYCSECDTTKCTNCIDDFILVNGECKYCRDTVANCKYARNGKCSECFYGYYAVNDKCEPVEEGCEEYRNGKCIECHDGYKLTNGKCEKCKVAGCEECDRSVDTCEECMDGYVLSNNQCIQPIANCEEYDDDRSRNGKYYCEECLMGYQLINNECVKIEGNCMTMENGTCVKCFGPFIPVDGKCEMDATAVPEIANCIEYDEDGEYECEKCAEGYYTNGAETECLACDPSCKTCDDRATECETCAEGYYVNERDKCVKCQNPLAECSTYKSEETCFQCNNKCNWVERKGCVESHCAEYESGEDDPKCMKCESGYVLSTNQMVCEPSNDGCKTKEGEKCVECHQGYFITNDFKCEKCHENCKSCVFSATNCHSCTKETGVSSTSCIPCQDMNCLECPTAPEKCIKCSGNYTVTELGTCAHGCYKENCDGKCTMCSDEQNNMNIYYPPTEEGRCLKYSEMPNTPNSPVNPNKPDEPNTPNAANTVYTMMVLLLVVLFMMI